MLNVCSNSSESTQYLRENWLSRPGELAFSCNPSYREASSWDGVGRMASLTLQILQICVRTKAIFKLEIKGKELDSW